MIAPAVGVTVGVGDDEGAAVCVGVGAGRADEEDVGVAEGLGLAGGALRE